MSAIRSTELSTSATKMLWYLSIGCRPDGNNCLKVIGHLLHNGSQCRLMHNAKILPCLLVSAQKLVYARCHDIAILD